MIYTLTLNPALDYVINLDSFQLGSLNRITNEYKYPGGKGINVSRVLNNFAIKNVALGFVGGFVGNYIADTLKNEGVITDFINITSTTRINVKVKTHNEETEFNAPGPTISSDQLAQLFNKVNQLNASDFLVLSGNVPKSLPHDIYAHLQEKCSERKIKVIVDTSGTSLSASLAYKPFLIKPNQHELAELFQVNLESHAQIIEYAYKLQQMGATNIIISMAKAGAIFIDATQNVYHAQAPTGAVQNSVGAGDSMVAGFLANYTHSGNLLEAFRLAIAAGSATAFLSDLCNFTMAQELLPQIVITKF